MKLDFPGAAVVVRPEVVREVATRKFESSEAHEVDHITHES